MDLQKLNEVSLLETKAVVKLAELPVNIPQPIYGAQLIKTKFGETVLLEFEEKKAFLPKRVVPLMKDNLTQFTDGKYSIVYEGLKDVKKPSMGVLFQFVETEAAKKE